MNKKKFDVAIQDFVKNITVAPEYIDALMSKIGEQMDSQLAKINEEAVVIDLRIANLRDQIRQSVDKIRCLSSATTIKYMEEDIENMEQEILELNAQRGELKTQEVTNIDKAKAYVRYFLENLDLLLLNYDNPIQQARYFGVIFNEAPSFQDIVFGTPDLTKIKGVNSIFQSKNNRNKLHGWG